MAYNPFSQLVVPAGLQPHTVSVSRNAKVGTDASGKPVFAPTVIYGNLSCAVDLESGGGDEAAGRPTEEYAGTLYASRQADGSFPDVRRGDLITFGTWPTGQPRVLVAGKARDTLDAGVVLVVPLHAQRPA